jgi:hypothetical protein
MELEAQHKQEHAKHEGIGANPQSQDHSANKRLNDQQDAEDSRGNSAEGEPPATVIEIKAKGRREHQCARHNRPNRNDPNQHDECNRGPKDRDCAGSKINDPFENEQAPVLATAGARMLEMIAKTPSTNM